MRIVLLLIIALGLGVLALSNWSPALALVFLGMQTPALPLAVWVGGAIAAGALTSFFFQFLSYLQRGYSAPRVTRPRSAPSPAGWTRPDPPEPATQSDVEAETDFTPPKTPTDSVASDWEESSEGDWNFTPEEESTSQGWEQQEFRREPPQEPARTEPRDREQRRESKPKSPSQSRSSSTYSYGYREPKDSGVGKTEVVYDANYRVITPPYRNLEEPETRDRAEEAEEEDWGFEFDEEEGVEREGDR